MITKPSIIEILELEGITLKPHGRIRMIKCFFHEDSEPSLAIYPETNTYHCFGCGAHGDVFGFLMRYKGMTFREAVKYSGVSDYVPQQIGAAEATKRALVEQFREWGQAYYGELCTLYRMIQNHKTKVKCIDDISQSAYHAEPLIEYRLDILTYGNDKAKFGLFQEVMNDGR